MADTDSSDLRLRDYARVLWRRKWAVVGIAVLITALATAYTMTRTPMYQATATLIYQSQLDVADPLATSSYIDPTQREVELDSVAAVIASPDLASNAKALLPEGVSSDFAITAAPGVTSGSGTASTVAITAESPDAQTAAKAANAYAQAFTAYRRSESQAQVRQAVEVVQQKLDTYTSASERESSDYVTLKQRLQDLQILEATVTGNFRVLIPAKTPKAPFSPDHVKTILLGLVAGLVLGIGAALVLEQFDTRMRSTSEVVDIFGLPLLATVPKLPAKTVAERPLVVLGDGSSPAGESIRKLRFNLEFANLDGNLKSLVMTSALQHEGKSVTAANLALSMAATGVRTVLVDGDLRRPQVHRLLDLPNRTGLSTVLTGRSELLETLRSRAVGVKVMKKAVASSAEASTDGGDRLYALTSGPLAPNAAEVIASKRFVALIEELKSSFELVIIDAPSVLAVGDTAAIARSVDGLVFLVDLTQARRPALQEAARQISQMACRGLGLVVVGKSEHGPYSYARDSYYAEGESPLDGSGRKAAGRNVMGRKATRV